MCVSSWFSATWLLPMGGYGETGPAALKCARDMSVKAAPRMTAKIAEACEGGGGDWPHCARVTDALRASVLCDDAEAFWHCFRAIRGDPADEAQTLRVVRLRNKLGAGKTPFNLHVNGLFRPTALADPILVEIQIWATPIMALNDVSHAQYEVVRAGAPGDI